MRALSVRQVWAGLIVTGIKDVENRDWGVGHRGLLIIHASKKIDNASVARFASREGEALLPRGGLPSACDCTGAYIGAVQLDDCTRRGHLGSRNNSQGRSIWHEDGKVGWYMSSPIVFPNPIPASGALGLFDVPNELQAKVRRQLDRVRV